MRTEMVIAALAAVIAAAAFADRTIETTAPDGVNKVTTTVNDAGYVTGRQMTCVHVPQKYVEPTDDENATMKQTMIDALEAAKRQETKRVADSVVVEQVYGEGTNSSFVTRKELTATQKRFLALGHRYTQLAIAYWKLEARLRKLEAEGKGDNSATIVKGVK